jgi:hypothetical protein
MTGGRVAFCFARREMYTSGTLATDRLSICDWSHATETAPSLWWVSVSVVESRALIDEPSARHWSLWPSLV